MLLLRPARGWKAYVGCAQGCVSIYVVSIALTLSGSWGRQVCRRPWLPVTLKLVYGCASHFDNRQRRWGLAVIRAFLNLRFEIRRNLDRIGYFCKSLMPLYWVLGGWGVGQEMCVHQLNSTFRHFVCDFMCMVDTGEFILWILFLFNLKLWFVLSLFNQQLINWIYFIVITADLFMSFFGRWFVI